MLGDIKAVFCTAKPVFLKSSSNSLENFVSLSRINSFSLFSLLQRRGRIFLTCLLTHSWLGYRGAPVTYTFRVLILIKNSTKNILGPSGVSTCLVKKSQAHRVWKCLLIKLSQVSFDRSGAGRAGLTYLREYF